MKTSTKTVLALLCAFCLLTAGIVNYYAFHPDAIFSKYIAVHLYRNGLSPVACTLLGGYFTDAMWCSSLYCVVIALDLRFSLPAWNIRLLLMLPFVSEMLQFCFPTLGTFDLYDLLLYALLLVLFSIIHTPLNLFKMKKLQPVVYTTLTALVFLALALACATPSRTTYAPTSYKEPGLYGGITQWNGGIGDINGEVGQRLYVNGPTARCVNCKNCQTGTWTANHMVVSGTLPPGLSFESTSANIVGIPRERGHWIVQVKLYNITCNSLNYDGSSGFTQELRFHITGTGRVND